MAVPEPRCEQTTSLAGSAAIRPGLGTWQELLAVEGQSLAATEESDHVPASLPEEQHKSQPGALINAGCSTAGSCHQHISCGTFSH